MAKKKQFVTAAAAFAVAASAVAPAITADAATQTVRLKSDFVRGGNLDAALDKEYKGSEIHWYKSSIDLNKLGVFQTAKGFVKGKGIKVEKKLRVLNYAQEVKPAKEIVLEQGVPASGLRIQPVLFADGNLYDKPVSVQGFNTDKVGEFEGSFTYANKAFGSVTTKVKYKVVASKVAFSEVKHEVKGDVLSVSADVKNLKEGEKVELVIFPGKDESKALAPIPAEIKDGKVMASAKDIPAGTHSFILRSGDVKTAAVEFKVEEQALKVESVKAINNKEIIVDFNKELTEADAEALANYKLTAVTTGGAATIGSVELQNDKKSVVVTLGTEAQNQEIYKLQVKNVKGASGKVVETAEKEVKFFDVTAPTVDGVTVVAPRTVKVDFSEPLKSTPSVKLGNGSVSTTVTLSADKKSATVEFGIEPTVGSHDLEIQGGLDYANLKVEKVVKSFEYNKDTTAPTVSIEKADANTVTFKFSKPVSVKSVANVSAYHTINNSGAYVGGALTPVSAVNGYSDTYTVTFGTPLPEGNVKVFLNTKANALEDGWGNDVASAELTTTAVVDKAAPVITEVKAVTDKKLEVTFNENVNVTDAQKLANYILKDASGNVLSNDDYNFVNAKGEFLSNVTVVYSAKKATITLPSSLKGGNYSLTVKEIRDASFLQNKLTSQDVAVSVTDTTAWNITNDALRSSDNKKIRITFNETMSNDSLTDLSKYELRNANGAKVEFPTDTKVVVLNPKAVEIQLGAAEATATVVRVSGTLKDAAGNTFNELYKEVSISAEAGPALVPSSAKTTAINKVTFQVDQELQGSLTPTNFTVGGAQVFGGASYVNKDGKSTVTLTLKDSEIKFTTSATPTVVVASNALESIYGAKNAAPLTVTAADGVAPSVDKDLNGNLKVANTVNTDHITIEFDENLSSTYATLAATDLVITDNAGKTLVAGVDYTTTIATDTITVDLAGIYNGHEGKVTVASKDKPVYIKDIVGNAANSFAATEVTLADSTAPVIAASYPSATQGAAGTKQVTVKVKANEAGTAYFLVVTDNAAVPNAATVAASTDSVALTANTEASKVLTLAADATAYDVYVVVKDAAGNLTAPTKVDVTSPNAAPVSP